MKKAFVALGSNLNNPKKQVENALKVLSNLPFIELCKASSLYITAPIGYIDQPNFINAVAELKTSLSPHDLLAELLRIESEMGRKRSFVNAPRTLDLDLLCYQNMVLSDEILTLPHPRMHERAFVILPLNEIAPDLKIGMYGSVSDLAKQLSSCSVVRLK